MEKKGIGKAKIGLVASAVLIIILAVTNVWSYIYLQNQVSTLNKEKSNLQSQVNTFQSQINSLNTTYQDYVSSYSHSNSDYDSLNITYQDYLVTHSHSNVEYDALLSEYNSYVASHHYTDAEYDSVKNERDALKAPKLIKVNLGAEDVRHVYPWDPENHLHIYGEICNVGNGTSYNSKLHVVMYQSGGVVAKDTYVSLGTISGESWRSVDSNIYYEGSALVDWTLTLEWTATP
jgi:hypothetical protein